MLFSTSSNCATASSRRPSDRNPRPRLLRASLYPGLSVTALSKQDKASANNPLAARITPLSLCASAKSGLSATARPTSNAASGRFN